MEDFFKSLTRGVQDAFDVRMMVTVASILTILVVAVLFIPTRPFTQIRSTLGIPDTDSA